MSIENVKKFYEAVSKDETLKQKFVKLSQKHQDQPMDKAKMKSIIEEKVLPLAKQMGYSFTMDDLKNYEMEMQTASMNCELSDSELEAVTGGAFCLSVGDYSEDPNIPKGYHIDPTTGQPVQN